MNISGKSFSHFYKLMRFMKCSSTEQNILWWLHLIFDIFIGQYVVVVNMFPVHLAWIFYDNNQAIHDNCALGQKKVEILS